MSMAIKQTLCVLASLGFLATPAHAGGIDAQAVLGGALGGGAGAAVGSAIGGRDGAIIGGAIGGAAGAAIATDGNRSEPVAAKQVVLEREVDYVPQHHDNGLHRGHHKNKHGRHDD
jgi:outer membrane lipoprotein SlyB